MAINLTNVHISLDEFQRISSGWYNAGEVRLHDEHTLDKTNNHVATWWYDNKDEISHAETVAIKEALVKALSQHGVEGDALARARQKLGLQPMDPSDKSLLKRSVMPLTRQQIREILDENAATLNQSEGHGRIRTQAELDARKGDKALEKSTAKRNEVNAALASRTEFHVNTEIARFERVVSDFADFVPEEECLPLLDIAKKQLDELMATCNYHPRADHRAIAKCEIEGGQQVTIDTGLNEVEFAERLENFIARLWGGVLGPKADELEVVSRYRACKSRAEQQDFLNALPTEQEFGFKARALAVRSLYSRKVTDYATLSLVNRITAGNAYALARAIMDMPANATPEQVRANPLLMVLKDAEPVKVEEVETAYIPATSNQRYNEYVFKAFESRPEWLLPAHRQMAMEVRDEVHNRLGEDGMPANTPLHLVANLRTNADINPANWGEARRNTAETIRGSFLAAALEKGAQQVLNAELKRAITALGGNPEGSWTATNCLQTRCPDVVRSLAQAQSPDEVQQILARFRGDIDRQVSLYCKVKPIADDIVARTKRTLGKALGVSPDVFGDREPGVIYNILAPRTELWEKILCGEVRVETEADIEKAFQDMVDGRVNQMMACLRRVDEIDPKLEPHVADHLRLVLFGLDKFDHIDVVQIANMVRNGVNTAQLDDLLKGNGNALEIQQAMHGIQTTIAGIRNQLLAGKQGVGAEGRLAIIKLATVLAIHSRPGLADRIDAFFLRPDVRPQLEQFDDSDLTRSMDMFHQFSFHPGVFEEGPEHAAKMHAFFAAPREMAAFKAAGGEVAALQAGYHAKDMPMLARAFTLVKAANNLADKAAMDEILNPASDSRRLFSYGGRFVQTPENFRKGLALMAKFREWRAEQLAAYTAGDRNTPTLLNVRQQIIRDEAERGLEKFVLEEIASNPAFDLDEQDDDKLFAMENNKAMRFVGLNYGDSGYCTLAAVPPAKRALLFDVVDLLRGPVAHTQAEKEEQRDFSYRTILLARILKHSDELEDLKLEGHFDRARVVPLLFGDLNVAATATAGQIDDAIGDAIGAMPPEISFAVSDLASCTGATFAQCRTAIEQGQPLPNAPYVVTQSPALRELGTADAARETLLGDILRPENAGQLPANTPILDEAQLHFTFRIQGAAPLVARWEGPEEEVRAANRPIADKLAELCGNAHPEQFSAVCYAMSQSGAGAKVRSAFTTHHIGTNEHLPLSFNITRSNETGAIEITCSEPAGFPLHFHWTTTVALDGTVTSTPLVIEQPPQQPQPQPANP